MATIGTPFSELARLKRLALEGSIILSSSDYYDADGDLYQWSGVDFFRVQDVQGVPLDPGSSELVSRPALVFRGDGAALVDPANPSRTFALPSPSDRSSSADFRDADNIDTEAKAANFLRQATLGPTYAEIQAATAVGSRKKWLNDQFQLSNNKGYMLRCFLDKGITDFSSSSSTFTYDQDNALMELMYEEPVLRAKLTWTLSKLYLISHPGGAFQDQSEVYAWASWWDRLDTFVFGNWRDLIESITYSPHMSQMLTYRSNTKESPTGTQPDENYAREIMQLFSIGLVMLNEDGTVKLDSGGQPIPTYGNDDIRQVARALTGLCVWNFAQNASENYTDVTGPSLTKFQQVILRSTHYTGMAADPTIRLKHWLPAYEYGPKLALDGRLNIPDGTPPEENLKILHDALFNHPNLPPFFAIRMIQHLVTSNPSPGYVARVSAAFKNNGAGVRGDLKAVWTAILTDPEASEDGRTNIRFGRVRDSFDVFINAWRSLNRRGSGGAVPMFRDGNNSNSWVAEFGRTSYRMQPSIFGGYDPLHSPEELRESAPGMLAPELQAWSDSACVRGQNRLQDTIRNFEPRDTPNVLSPAASYAELPLTGTAAALVERLNLLFCGGKMTPSLRADILSFIGSMATGTSEQQQDRVSVALQTLTASSDFHVQV